MKYLKRQDGIAHLLMVGLVAVVLVVIGVAVWQSQQAKSKADQTASTPTPTAVSSATPTSSGTPVPSDEFKVTELGFKMTLPKGLADLKYAGQTNVPSTDGNGTIAKASFSTSSLEAKDSANSLCTPAHAPLGVIVQYDSQPKGLDSSIPVRKVGNFYLAYSAAQSACSDDNGIPNLVLSQAALLKQAFEGATSL